MTDTTPTTETDDESIELEIERVLNVVDIKTKSILAEGVTTGEAVPLVEHTRWPGAHIPVGYRLSIHGVHRMTETGPSEPVCGPIYILAQTLTPTGGDAGLVLEFEDRDGKFKTIVIPRSRLYEDPKILSAELGGQLNFYLCPGKEKDLLIFLSKILTPKTDIACPQTGWVDAGPEPAENEPLNFVFPTYATSEGLHYQPERYSPTAESVRPSGTLKDWIQHVYSSDPYLLFSVLVSLSGCLIRAAGTDSGGFHLWGDSTSGKTSAAQVAASVWGNGSEPATDGNSYIRRWNMSRNGSESICSSTRDMCLVLDELHTCPAKDAGAIVYDISGGQGKAVQDSSRNLRKIRHWRLSIFSTGEISMQAKIEEAPSSGGKKTSAKAGQGVRIIDIHVRKDYITQSAGMAEKIKRYASKYYGTLGPAFITAMSAKWTAEQLQIIVQDALDKAVARIVSNRGEISDIQRRAIRRFALCEVAGILLTHLGLIPGFNPQTVRTAIDRVIDDWMPSAVNLSDSARAIDALRDFILANRDLRFLPYYGPTSLKIASDRKLPREIAGYISEKEEVIYLLPDAFRQAINAEPKIVAQTLKEQKLLVTEKPDRYTCRIRVDNQRIYVYGIRAALLGDSVGELEG